MEYKINAVSEKVEEWSSQYGPMKTYYVKFDGQTEPVKINQKDSTPAPTVGQTLFGSITEDKFGKKFKKESNFSGGAKPAKNDDGMAWGNALTNAVQIVKDGLDPEEVLKVAKTLFDGRNQPAESKSGYEKLKETVATIRPPKEEKEEPPVESYDDLDTINLDDIPF